MHRLVGKKKRRYQHREPSFYLISAVQVGESGHCLCLLKPSWPGYGTAGNWKWPPGNEKRAGDRRKAVLEYPRGGRVSPMERLGLCHSGLGWLPYLGLCGVRRACALVGRRKRWSFNTLWRSYRAALWGTAEFRPFGLEPGITWKKETGWQD